MVRLHLWMLASLLALPAAVEAQVAPGQWEISVTIKSMDMPGAPPQIAQLLKKQGATKISKCMTPEQAARPEELLKPNPSCHFTSFSMSGGKIATETSCSQNGQTVTARASGTYDASSFSIESNAATSGRMNMRMTSNTVGRRVGPC